MRYDKSEKAFQNAIRTTINKMLVRGRKVTTQEVRKVYNIKSGKLKEGMKIKRATNYVHEGRISVKGNRLKLFLFSAKQNKKGVTVRIRKDSGRKLIRHAFVATMPASGRINVWMRKGKSRLPIKGLFSLSAAKMIEMEGEKAFNAIVKKDFEKVFRSQLRFYLEKT